MQFTITSEHTKMRLDKFLTEHFPDFSRSHLQKLVKEGLVTVNSKRVTVHHFLKTGDAVEATIEPIAELRVIPNPAVRIIPSPPTPLPKGEGVVDNFPLPAGEGGRRPGEGTVVQLVHEEPDFVVVNKPAGMVVHQAEGHKTPDTLVNGLLARYPEIARVGDDTIRPGIMHRLDGDVSGVMVVARNQDMFDHLKRQFKLHEAQKEYIAVVKGEVSPPSGVIEFAIARKGAKMVARPKGAEGSKAITEYETLKTTGQQDNRTTLLKIQTRTGRTHQIRVHLKAKGWPIVGDKLYGTEHTRLMLHARKLAFTDLTGKKREFIIEPPRDFTYHGA